MIRRIGRVRELTEVPGTRGVTLEAARKFPGYFGFGRKNPVVRAVLYCYHDAAAQTAWR